MVVVEFTEHKISTITAGANLLGVVCLEEDMPILCKTSETIVCINSNFCENQHESYKPPEKLPISKRGRRPKSKAKKPRKVQGSGKYLNSQTTFYVIGNKSPKPYKLKLFRNGAIQIPGVRNENLDDAFYAINETIKTIAEGLFVDVDDITLMKPPHIVMMNYGWSITNTALMLNLEVIKNELLELNNPNMIIDKFQTRYNPEKYQGLICKVRSCDSDIYATFKVFISGKINVTLKTGTDDIQLLKDWFCEFLSNSNGVYDTSETIIPVIRG